MKKHLRKLVLLSIVLVFFGIKGFGQSSGLPVLPNKTIEGWIYPGNPACNANTEYSDGRIIDVLRPEYLALDSNGIVVEVTVSSDGCNGYNITNAADVKNHSTGGQFITVSGAGASLYKLLSHINDNNWITTNVINPIVKLVDTTGFTGIELDFESPTGGWSDTNWAHYQSLITTLGYTLHNYNTNNKKLLNITLPPDLSSSDLSFFNNNNNVDFVTIMCYDYETLNNNDPVAPYLAPNAWVGPIINTVKTAIGNVNKIVIGMPSYGYHIGTNTHHPTQSIIEDTKTETISEASSPTSGSSPTATNHYSIDNPRDISSNERYFIYNDGTNNGTYDSIWYYQDAVGMSMKEEFIRSQGIKHVCVWHLGGNDWFNKFDDTSYRQVTAILDSTLWKNASKALSYSTTHDTTCAYPSSLNASNQIIFVDTINYTNALFKGLEVAIIGHAENDTNQCSTISVEYSNDGINWYSPESVTGGVNIYSNHDVIKIIGSQTDNWGFTSAPFVAYQIRIKYLSGAVPHINGVFVKMYFGSPGQQGTIALIDTISNRNDDAADAITFSSNGNSSIVYDNDSLRSTLYTHHRFGIYKGGEFTYGAYFINGFRFNNITIPQGCTIDSAYLDLFYDPVNRTVFDSSNFSINFYGEDNINPQPFPSKDASPSTYSDSVIGTPYYRPLLPISPIGFTFNESDWGTTSSSNGYYNAHIPVLENHLIDVKDIVQAIVNIPTWNSGNSLSIIAKLLQTSIPTPPIATTENNCVGYSTYESIPGKGATRIIIYYETTESSYCEYYNTPQHITSDTTWNDDPSNPKIVLNDMIVNSGVTLTITGTVEFTQQAKLIVQQGGVVIVDGGTLTNLCDNKTWRGIEVWGTSGKGQNSLLNSPYQGMVQLINGAEIDNAEDAIKLWHPNDTTTTGGIVIANNATFYNNRRSIDFEPYQNKIISPTNDITNIGNLSQFVNCTFDVDDDYMSDNEFYCHASLWKVNSVFFQGCTFMNEQSNKQYSLTNNKGIYSMDAGFTVNSYCSDNVLYGESCPYESKTPCYFYGFNYAIDALDAATSNVAIVDESVFEQNVIGVQFKALNNSWVNRSNFSIGDNTITNVTSGTYPTGIVIIGSTGYRIEEDSLQPSSNLVSNTIGIRINNSKTANNQVYKNISNGLYIAEQAEGVNRDSTYNYKGLQLLCNTHSVNNYDIIVPLTGASHEGIRVFQGDPNSSTSAGNIFSQNISIPESNIKNGTSSVIMYYYTNGLTQPLYVTPFLVDTIHVNNANTCPSNFNNGYSFPLSIESVQTFATNYGLLESTYLNLLYNYNSMIDGGDENLLLNKIESTWSNDAWKMRADLLAKSPYLSEDALEQAALSDILPQAMLLEVCLANPDATRDEGFIYFLANKIPNPLPQYMLDLIVENWHAKTARTLLEANLADVSSQMSVITNLLVSNYMLDTIQQKDIALNWLLRRGDLSDYYSAVEHYIESNDYISANNYRRQIPELFKLTDDEHAEYLNFKEYLAFRNSIASDNRNIMQLTDDEITNLQQIADNNTGRSSILAQNILCFCYQLCVDYLPADGEGDHLKFSKPKIPASQIIQSAYNKITATPNPASVYVAFTWTLPLLKGNAVLFITDINGKTIAQQTITTKAGQWIWDTRAIKNSIYLYEVRSDNQRLGNGKIVINN